MSSRNVLAGIGGSSNYLKRQQKSEEQKAKELETLRKEVDALVVLVQNVRRNLERVPSKLEALVAGFGSSIKTLAQNYDLRDSSKLTTPIVNNVCKISSAMEAELSTATRSVFQEKTFNFLKNWADTLFKLQIRFKNLNKAQQSYEHYTKKVAHLVHERERRKARGKGEDAVHIEKMARNEEKLRTAAGTFHTERQQLLTMVKAALAAKVPYLNQVYHNYTESLRLVFNSGKHETEPFQGAIDKLTQHMKDTRRDMLVETMHAEELMDPSSPFRQNQRDIDAARGRDGSSSGSPEGSPGKSLDDDEAMERDDFWTPGGAANSGWDVQPREGESEDDDDSFGDSDDDGWSNTVTSPSASHRAQPSAFGSTTSSTETSTASSFTSGFGSGFGGDPWAAPAPAPAPARAASDDFFGLSFSPSPAPAPAPVPTPDLYSRPMPVPPVEDAQPLRRKGPYIWDYTYSLWRHQSNGTYYNEKTKLYTRNPAAGQWLRLVNGQLVP